MTMVEPVDLEACSSPMRVLVAVDADGCIVASNRFMVDSAVPAASEPAIDRCPPR